MKKLLLLVLLLPGMLQLNAQITFQETFGGPRTDVSNTIFTTRDSGFIISGYTEKFTYAWQRKMLMMRLDKNGDTLWQHSFGGANAEEAICGKQVRTGFTAVGTTSSYRCIWSDFSLFVLATDSSGNQTAAVTYCCDHYNIGANDFLELPDSSLVILGHAELQTDLTTRNILLMRIKPSANYSTVWVKSYSMPGADWGYSLDRTADGGYIIAGETQGLYTGVLIKTDSSGNLQWTKSIPTMASLGIPVQLFSCRQTRDHGYIVAGEIWIPATSNLEIYLFKLDSTGAPLWSESIRPQSVSTGCSVYPTCIEELKDGGFILSSVFQSTNAMEDNYVVRTDSVGHVLWSMRYGGPNDERHADANRARGVDNGNDNQLQYAGETRAWIAPCLPIKNIPQTYILTSFTTSFVPSANGKDVYVVKIAEGGWSGCNEVVDNAVVTPQPLTLDPLQVTALNFTIFGSIGPTGTNNPAFVRNLLCTSAVGMQEINPAAFSIYPNPAGNLLILKIPNNSNTRYVITNLLGDVLLSEEVSDEENPINISQLASGIYFVTVFKDGQSSTQKFIRL